MHFKKHMFFCVNQKDNNKKCCAQAGATQMFTYAKEKVATEGLKIADKVRVNKAGCLGRCEAGPCMVIYPEGVWYTYQNEDDIDEIIGEHLKKNIIVSRLLIPNSSIPESE